MNEVLQAITTVGFPISMCLIMAWYTLALQHLADLTERGK